MKSFPGESFTIFSKHLERTLILNIELSQLVIFAIKVGIISNIGDNLYYIYIELYYPHKISYPPTFGNHSKIRNWHP